MNLFESKSARRDRIRREREDAFDKEQEALRKHREENPTIEDRVARIEAWIEDHGGFSE